MIMIAIVFLIIMIITYWSWCSLWKLSLNYWGVQRKVKVKISLILSIIFTRYNVNGFVEELPQLPDVLWGHACSALPPNGVRPVQPIFHICRHLLWPEESTMDPSTYWRWYFSLGQRLGSPSPPSLTHWDVLKHRLLGAGSGWMGVSMVVSTKLRWC